jgi:hypothetical protein
MLDASAKMLARWREVLAGSPVAMNLEMMRLTMSAISRSIFAVDIGEEFAEAGQARRSVPTGQARCCPAGLL